MNDACASGVCEGKVTLKAAVTLAMDTEELIFPAADASPAELDASPLATAVKDSLVTALASAMSGLTADDITILSLSTARRRLESTRRLQAGVPKRSGTKQGLLVDKKRVSGRGRESWVSITRFPDAYKGR